MTNQTKQRGHTPKHWDGVEFTKEEILHAAAPALLEACKKAVLQLTGCAAWLKSAGQGQVACGTDKIVDEIQTAIGAAEGGG